MVILGPSGFGKTTLLKMIAGVIPVESGSIEFDGKRVDELKPMDRKIGMVFQDYALYPHLTSKSNVLFYFFFKRKTQELYESAREKFDRTSELMGVELAYLPDRNPGTLSGGEKQRVAIARCITRDPNVFLLDETFSNLDQMLREKYRLNVKKLLGIFDITTVYVTHDQHEALVFADIIAIMRDGRIEQTGSSTDIYNDPGSLFVAEFINTDQYVPAINTLPGGYMPGVPDSVIVGIRPRDIKIGKHAVPGGLQAVILEKTTIPMQKEVILTARVHEKTVYIVTPPKDDISFGDTVTLDIHGCFMFDKDTGKRIRDKEPVTASVPK
ncbi:MAG: ABC transporter ATP-binding protein [Spirochaetales bacterium]|nr:ABC transporter ATP-binding protein [Spirochaetales bacterium]